MPRFPYRHRRRTLISILACALGGRPCPAAEAAPPSWAVRVWRTTEGLPDDRIASLAQTPDGFIWITAGQQLARFDGCRFQSVAPAALADTPGHAVEAVLRLGDGRLCVAMDQGTIVVSDAAGARVWVRKLTDTPIHTLVEAGDHAIWALYRGTRLFRIRPDGVQAFNLRNKQPGENESALARDARGRIWFYNAGQVSLYQDGAFAKLCRIPSDPGAMTAARGGGMWICVGRHLLRCDGAGHFHLDAAVPLTTGSSPTAILEDRSGALWIGTTLSGVLRFDGTRFQNVPISHREVLSLLEDGEGSLWVGTKAGGLDQVQPRTIALEGSEIGLPSDSIQAVAQGPDGTMWGLTQQGTLVSRVAQRWQPALPPGGNFPDVATCLAVDGDGAVWIGTQAHGPSSVGAVLLRWKNGRLQSWGRKDGILSHTLRVLHFSRAGDLWIGGEGPGGVMRMHDGRIETMPLPPNSEFVRAIAEDRAGDIWVGANRSLLLKISGGAVENESRLIEGRRRPIRALEATADGSLWIAFERGGIGRLQGRNFVRLVQDTGLFDDNIAAMTSDGRGWIWCATGKGIFKFREHDVDALASGRASNIACVPYGYGQGLGSPHLAYGDAPIAFRSRDGRIWIPSATQLAIIDPAVTSPVAEAAPPPPLITRLAADGRTLFAYRGAEGLGGPASASGLSIPAGARELQISFTSFSFSAPENVRFRYRLDPFDEDWVDGGAARFAAYSRLPPDHYRFQVQACDSEGIWGAATTRLAFAVRPFFWQTLWFRLGALAAFTAGIALCARYFAFRRLRARVRALEQQAALDHERARIARDIHDELGGRLTKIVLLTGLIGRDRNAPEQAGERVREVGETARQLLASLDETVWAVNPRNDTLPHLIDYIGQSAVKFLRTAEIPCQVELPDDTPDIRVSSDVRHNLFLAVQEALNNVVRHAQATAARLRVRILGGSLDIAIEDNGCGFAGAPTDPGADGLRNMRERMSQIGGSFSIESVPGAGTSIRFALPRAAWS